MKAFVASVCAALLYLSPPAGATGTVTVPPSLDAIPKLHKLNAREAKRIANANQELRDYIRRFKRYKVQAFIKGPSLWQVSYFNRDNEVAQVTVDENFGAAAEVWTGPQVAWTMARGIEGAFGRKITKAYVWLPLMLLFFLPFFQWRRPFRLLHLDLLVLLAFSLSHYFFNRGEIYSSVPLAYPVLVYLLIRMLLAAYSSRVREGEGGLKLSVPVRWLAILLVFLIGFRVAINVIDSNVIDVGYSGVIGADRIAHGEAIYGTFPKDNQHGDTYGPVNYFAYLPFELAMPWHGKWDALPAAHAAALLFDLGTVAGLFLVGYSLARRRRGPPLKDGDEEVGRKRLNFSDPAGFKFGVVLAYSWVAFPYTLFASNSNSNDSLVALLLVFGFLLMARPAGRGALLALATFTKFAAGILAPLWLSFPDVWKGIKEKLIYIAALAAVSIVVMLPVIIGWDWQLFWEKTVKYQLERGSPFSLWGLYPESWGKWQDLIKYLGIAFVIFCAFIPRRKNLLQIAALSAALLIVTQLAITHWFYLYIVWFFPLVMIVVLGREGLGESEKAKLP